jgi:hypothetical protein
MPTESSHVRECDERTSGGSASPAWQLYVFADWTVSALPIPIRREPAWHLRQAARLEGTGRAERGHEKHSVGGSGGTRWLM